LVDEEGCRVAHKERPQGSRDTAGKVVPAGTVAVVRSSDSLRAPERATALSTLIHQRRLTPSCGGHVPTAERTVGPARMIVESLTPRPGIREQNRTLHRRKRPICSALHARSAATEHAIGKLQASAMRKPHDRGAPSIFDRRYVMEMGRRVCRRSSFWLSRLFKAYLGARRRRQPNGGQNSKASSKPSWSQAERCRFGPVAKHYSRLRAEELPQSMIAP
jgi:hypothetical protein